uniref:Tetratricopeptide repeat domain 12 n=1 Tax=Seriola dumerili TaxID=41447 RepID=A0A3B4VHW2_SERDU
MKIMERDAEDRRIKRIAKEKKATALKDKGNEAYAQGDYETAVKYYSDGLDELRDMQPLYTNRAQVNIFNLCCSSFKCCTIGLITIRFKCNERCIKAYVHMGKAFMELKKYNEAKYLIQVGLEAERENQEMNAREEFDKGEVKARTVPQLLEKLSRPGQMPLFYRGGLELLLQAVTDCEGRSGRSFAQLSSSSNLFLPTLSPITCFTCLSIP